MRHLIDTTDISVAEVDRIINTALDIIENRQKYSEVCKGKKLATLFYEPSTRTRLSFELAEKRLSADVINVQADASSLRKGESLLDTVKNIRALQVDIVVMRHSAVGAPNFLSRELDCAIVNAGDGAHSHPTQALLDMFTMREKKGRIEGLNVTIIGDILHSRVARSNIWGLLKLGANVTIAGPATLVPKEFEQIGVRVCRNLKDAVKDADVINLLRIQHERQRTEYFPGIGEYAKFYGINPDSMKYVSPDALIMHPGPINRGVELDSVIADGPQSVILEQVTNGLAVRMAVLFLVAGCLK